ncbi:MAG: ArnT family glycosyltransferase [Cyclobacteriaceae bacterium]
MGKQGKKIKKVSPKAAVAESARTSEGSWLEKLENHFKNNNRAYLIISGILLSIFTVLFFDPKVSIGGDDAEYINRSYEFLSKGVFPSFQGPLYPILISLLYAFTGLNIIIFKLLSVVFNFVFVWYFYRLFKKHLPQHLSIALLIIICTNAVILWYASSTYTETFFLMLQAIFLYYFDKFIISNSAKDASKKQLLNYVLCAFLLFLLFITKNVGLAAFLAATMYLLVSRKFKALLYLASFYIVFMAGFETAKRSVWKNDEVQISSQSNTLLNKHPYDKSMGREDAKGFVLRFVTNSNDYLSRHFLKIFGLRGENAKPVGLFTLIIYGLFFAGLVMALRKSPFWLFVGLYIGISCAVVFIILQTYWSQDRLILVYTPLILAFILYVSYQLFYIQLQKVWLYMLVVVLFFGGNLVKTLGQIPENATALQHYLNGESLYGLTPDWVNFIKISMWASKNLPKEAYVASRKPGISFIYGKGKEFHGIWNVPSEDPDELYDILKKAGVTHIIVGSLRVNPDQKTDRVINTVHRYLSIIYNAYPDRLQLIHKEGVDEQAFLYELK